MLQKSVPPLEERIDQTRGMAKTVRHPVPPLQEKIRKCKQLKEALLGINTMREFASDKTLKTFEVLVREEEEIQENLDISLFPKIRNVTFEGAQCGVEGLY